MPINYAKVRPQVEKMGRMMAHKTQDLSERAETAFQQFRELPDNETLLARVKLARTNDAGYRGAAPMGVDGEPVWGRYALPEAPVKATILASDGSQVYPDIHLPVFYYLINMSVFTFFHGEDRLPLEYSEPELFYTDTMLRDENDQLVTNATVNARRTVTEMKTLAQFGWEQRHLPQPLLAIFDGRLLFWIGKDVPESSFLEDDYRSGFVRLRDTDMWMMNKHGHHTNLAGFVDRPTSRFVIALLQLMRMDEDDITRQELKKPGEYEGLDDRWLYERWLRPGERSALMIQQSPQNKYYRLVGDSYEIVFFYLNVGQYGTPQIARIEIPMWVARSEEAVNEVHSLIVSQCRIAGYYPYVLTRADELAVVRNFDRHTLTDMIQTELLRHQQHLEESAKLMGKYQTRSGRLGFAFGQPKYSGRE